MESSDGMAGPRVIKLLALIALVALGLGFAFFFAVQWFG